MKYPAFKTNILHLFSLFPTLAKQAYFCYYNERNFILFFLFYTSSLSGTRRSVSLCVELN